MVGRLLYAERLLLRSRVDSPGDEGWTAPLFFFFSPYPAASSPSSSPSSAPSESATLRPGPPMCTWPESLSGRRTRSSKARESCWGGTLQRSWDVMWVDGCECAVACVCVCVEGRVVKRRRCCTHADLCLYLEKCERPVPKGCGGVVRFGARAVGGSGACEERATGGVVHEGAGGEGGGDGLFVHVRVEGKGREGRGGL